MNHSNRLFAFLLAAAATVGVAAPATALLSARSVPPESFLDYHVDTAPQLAFEVAYDKAVRGRLARHFHLSGPAMSAYVRDNLVLQRLRAPRRTRVYAVTAHGREHYVLMTLRAGTPVFALRQTGEPVLRLVCGNPLVRALPAVPKKKKIVAARPAVKPLVKLPVKTLVKPMRMTLITPYTTPAEVIPAAWSVPAITTSGSSVLFTKGAAAIPGWLGLLPVGGVLAAAFPPGHGGGGGSQGVSQTPGTTPTTPNPATPNPVTTPVPPGGGLGNTPGGPGGTSPGGPTSNPPTELAPVTPTGPAPEPVPEPSPVWVFALGGLGVGVLMLRKRRSERR